MESMLFCHTEFWAIRDTLRPALSWSFTLRGWLGGYVLFRGGRCDKEDFPDIFLLGAKKRRPLGPPFHEIKLLLLILPIITGSPVIGSIYAAVISPTD